MEARLAVASIDIFNESNHVFGTLTACNQEVRYALTIAAWTGMVVNVYGNHGSSYSVESHHTVAADAYKLTALEA
jgi:hypothetical protein